ncbi:hypothetical protein LOZ66_005822 [Ophidiomyces ophidiicola]|nr:hypothetical protein LOZ66_005822 [Ophidiomyces ophidiicola]
MRMSHKTSPLDSSVDSNRRDHIAELKNTRPKKPFFFLKPTTSLLTTGTGNVIRPKGVRLHYEVELGLIMGQRLRDSDPNDETTAMNAISGYVVAIDMTARNVQDSAKRAGLPWSIAKGFDTFCPISNFIPKTAIPDPHNATLHLSVNDAVRQNDSTGLMLYRIPRILSEISMVMTLEPGDVVLTGTPKGVGEVKHGDVMKAGIKVNKKAVPEAGIEVAVRDSEGKFEFGEF